MPDMNDFHAFKSTSSGGSSGAGGCSGSILLWIMIIVGVLWLLGKFAS